MLVLDAQGNILEVNSAFCELMECSEAQVLDAKIYDIISQKYIQQARENIDTILTTGFLKTEINFVSRSGRVKYLELWETRITLPNGEPGVLSMETDVTARKEAELQAMESEARQRALLDAIPDLMFLFNKDGRYIDYKASDLSILYTHPDNFLHKTVSQVLPPDLAALTMEKMHLVLRTGTPQIYEYQIELGPDVKYFESRLVPCGEDRALAIVRDITERKRDKEALRTNKQFLQNILDNMFDVVALIDLDGNIKFFSGTDKEIDLDLEPSVGKSIFDFVHPEDLPRVTATFNSFIHEKQDHQRMEYRYRCGDGQYIWVESVGKFLRDDAGNPREVLLNTRDITDRKQAEDILKSRLNIAVYASKYPLEDVLQKTVDEICHISGSEVGYCHFVEDHEQTISLKAWSTQTLELYCHVEDHRPKRYPVEQGGVWVDCIKIRQPVIHNDYEGLPHRKGFPQGHPVIKRQLVVPIMKKGQVVAVLGVGNKPEDYTDSDVQLVSFFADLAWEVVEQKQAEDYIRYMSFHDCLTGLHNRAFLEEEMVRLEGSRDLPISVIMADLNGLKLVNDTYGHTVGDDMLKAAASVLMASCRTEDIITRWGGDEFVLLLPQTTEAEAHDICKRISEAASQYDIAHMPLSLATGVGVKDSAHKRLQEALKDAEDDMYKRKLSESMSVRGAVVHALLKTLEAKSYETEIHTLRMQHIALRIGEEMGLTESDLGRLRLLITLHDIGKINISEEVLTKAGPLNDEEWTQIKRHPEIGHRIANATGEFAHVSEEILSHHERWDGKGYPRGLVGDQIPLLARIVAVADAYEVMTNGRPYKKEMTRQEILDEFKNCAGSQFDPQVVACLLSLLESEEQDEAEGTE